MSRNKIFAAVALIIGLILVVVVFTDFPPEDSSIAGTMADPEKKIAGAEPADRYSSEQITDADVELDDATFQILMQDDDFVAIVNSEDMGAMVELAEIMARLDRKLNDARAVSEAGEKIKDSRAAADVVAKGAKLEKAESGMDRSGAALDRVKAGDKVSAARDDLEKGFTGRQLLGRAVMGAAERVRAAERAGSRDAQKLSIAFADELTRAMPAMARADIESLAETLAKINSKNLDKVARLVSDDRLAERAYGGGARRAEGFNRAEQSAFWALTLEKAALRATDQREARREGGGARIEK
ncbi:MAG: hypothetical protein IH951_15215 [Bacteroidetes bacterium]|nr:hypothetical protein [Bacteroidota bacterium]